MKGKQRKTTKKGGASYKKRDVENTAVDSNGNKGCEDQIGIRLKETKQKGSKEVERKDYPTDQTSDTYKPVYPQLHQKKIICLSAKLLSAFFVTPTEEHIHPSTYLAIRIYLSTSVNLSTYLPASLALSVCLPCSSIYLVPPTDLVPACR